MALSKPIFNLLGSYFNQLYNHPIRTKAISCCVIATAGNFASQYISGTKSINHTSLLAYATFGLLFGGTIPHYFYTWVERFISDEAAFPAIKKLLIERLIYSPLYIAFTLYVLARLEGKNHNVALKQLESLYWIILSSSWKYLTLIQLINMKYVPPMLRVLITNLVGFFWTVYIANKRREEQLKKSEKKKN